MLRFKLIKGKGEFIRGYRSQHSNVLEDIYVQRTTLEEELNLFLVDIKEEDIISIKIHLKEMMAEIRYKG